MISSKTTFELAAESPEELDQIQKDWEEFVKMTMDQMKNLETEQMNQDQHGED